MPNTIDILFIDDDPAFVHALRRVLEVRGFRVRHAPDGQKGVEMAHEKTPDLILLDFMMPGKNGFEVCTELKKLDAFQDVPILVMTAFGQNIGEIHSLGRETGQRFIEDVLEKPVEPNVLLERIAKALGPKAGQPGGP